MNTLTIDVPGAARGKARPRVTRYGTYTPDPDGYAERVTAHAVEAVNTHGWPLVAAGPGRLDITICREIPSSWSRRKREQLNGSHAVRTPDPVNVAAAVCDALESVIYSNDRQVVALEISQAWCDTHAGRTRIIVTALDDP